MKSLTKILIIGGFLAVAGVTYASSIMGLGVSSFKSHKTMEQIKKDCPDYYREHNGECLRTSFRSIYFLRTGYTSGTGK